MALFIAIVFCWDQVVFGEGATPYDASPIQTAQPATNATGTGQDADLSRLTSNTTTDFLSSSISPLSSPQSAFQQTDHPKIYDETGKLLLNISNKPSRMLARNILERLVNTAKYRKISTEAILGRAESEGLSRWQAKPLCTLLEVLQSLHSRLSQEASESLSWLVDKLDYLAYFQKYYGNGETADEKSNAVSHFIEHVAMLHTNTLDLLEQLAKLDTTQGRPEDELILFTTIFRTKGLEFDYVIIPQCDENLLPYLKGEHMDIHDTQHRNKAAAMSSILENERRLFYVGITRARKGVLIGTASMPSRFLQEIQLPQTQRVMTLVEATANGQADAKSELINLIRSNGHGQVLKSNLVNGYLPELNLNPEEISL